MLSLVFHPEGTFNVELPEVIGLWSFKPLRCPLLVGLRSPRRFSFLLEDLPDGRVREHQPLPLEPLFTLHNVQTIRSS
ncbi:MAG: hypothetical protein ACTSSG_09030 [Candidatus Heimdallarchaeaceae archaeon]